MTASRAPELVIRPGREDDLVELNELYNYYVRDSHITFDIEPITMEQRAEWFSHYDVVGRHRLLVAVDDDRVLGYASSSPYRPKAAYETTVEASIYLASEATGLGIGIALYSRLFEELAGEDVRRALGGIALPNPASIALHARFGFTLVGTYTEQGRKFGRYWDVAWYEKGL